MDLGNMYLCHLPTAGEYAFVAVAAILGGIGGVNLATFICEHTIGRYLDYRRAKQVRGMQAEWVEEMNKRYPNFG